jgi:dTDP-4-dehydrorhamnose reductase
MYTSGYSFSFPLVLHFSASQMLTKYDMACILADILGIATHNIKKSDQIGNATLSRPKNVQLDVGCLRDLGVNVETVDFKDWWSHKLKQEVQDEPKHFL